LNLLDGNGSFGVACARCLYSSTSTRTSTGSVGCGVIGLQYHVASERKQTFILSDKDCSSLGNICQLVFSRPWPLDASKWSKFDASSEVLQLKILAPLCCQIFGSYHIDHQLQSNVRTISRYPSGVPKSPPVTFTRHSNYGKITSCWYKKDPS